MSNEAQPVPGGGPVLSITHSVKTESVIMDFGGQKVAWVGLPPEDARAFAEAILQNADLLEQKIENLAAAAKAAKPPLIKI